MSEVLPLSLTKMQLPNGKWLISYNGDPINYDCGTYFLTVMIDGVKWYSELFTLKNVSGAVHPGLIMDTPHCAIRFYDNILKQNYYKCKNLCDLPLNPIDHIIPFVVDVSRYPNIDVNTIKTTIKCYNGANEYDLSSEMNYTYDSVNKVLIHDGHKLSGHLYCGIYYLQLDFGATSAILYEANFMNWVNQVQNTQTQYIPQAPVGLYITSTNAQSIAYRDNNKLHVIVGSNNISKVVIFFKAPFNILAPGNYKLKFTIDEMTGGSFWIQYGDENGGGRLYPSITASGTYEFDINLTGYAYYQFNCQPNCNFLMSQLSLSNADVTTSSDSIYSDHFLVRNFTAVPVENLYLYTESGTETGFEPIITDENGQEIILQL